MQTEYTVFQGRVGDHNDLAMPGARAIGEALARRTGESPTIIWTPEPALMLDWQEDLHAARPALCQLRDRFEDVFGRGAFSVAATSRCAASLATLPVVAKYHPSACVVWFDSHADMNTPDVTTSGFLGGLALSGPAGLWDSGFGAGLRMDQIILVGQRDLDPFEQTLIDCHAVPHVHPHDDLAARLRASIAGRPVYVHIDCDVLDPGIVPTDYIHPGGLSLDDLRTCCTTIAEGRLIGLEIAEFQDAWEVGGSSVSPEPLLDALTPLLRFGQGV